MNDRSAVLPNAAHPRIAPGIATLAAVACLLCVPVAVAGAHRLSLDVTADAFAQLALCLVEWGSWLIGWLPLGLWLVADVLLLRAWLASRSSGARERPLRSLPLALDQLR